MPKLYVYTGTGIIAARDLVPLRVRGDAFENGLVDLQVLYKRCGKADCTKCPHGPYAYLAIRFPGGRKQMKLVGRLPADSPLVPERGAGSSRRSAAGGRGGPRATLRRKKAGSFPRDTDSCSCGE